MTEKRTENEKPIRARQVNLATKSTQFYVDLPTRASPDLPTTVSILTVSLGTILGLTNPISSMVVLVFGTMLPMVWSSPEASSGEVWKSISEQIGLQINQAIEKLVFANAKAELEGIKDLSILFSDYMKVWDSTHTGLNSLRSKYSELDSKLTTAIPKFKVQDHENILLHFYSLATLTHLALLRLGYDKFEEWDLDTNSRSMMKEQLSDRIENLLNRYTDHILKTYRDGLKRIQNNWLAKNKFRNINTLVALDFCSTFQGFSCKTYKINIANLSLTRYLIEALIPKGSYNTIDRLERYIHAPVYILKNIKICYATYFTWSHIISGCIGTKMILDSVDGMESEKIYSYGYLDPNNVTGFPAFNENYTFNFDLGNSSIISVTGESVGNSAYLPHLSEYISPVGALDSVSLECDNKQVLNAFHFSGYKELHKISQQLFSDRYNSLFTKERVEKTAHKLNSISVNYDTLHGDMYYGFLWRHSSSDIKKKLSSGRRDIVQFNAIKAGSSIDRQSLTIVPGPGFTGGDLVKLKPREFLEVSFSSYELDDLNVYGNYKFRVFFLQRKNITSSISLTFSARYEISDSYNLRNAITLHETFNTGTEDTDLDNAYFKDLSSFLFDEVVMLRVKGERLKTHLKLENKSKSEWLIIDRIEFIPEN